MMYFLVLFAIIFILCLYNFISKTYLPIEEDNFKLQLEEKTNSELDDIILSLHRCGIDHLPCDSCQYYTNCEELYNKTIEYLSKIKEL